MQIPLIDLKAQYKSIKNEIDDAIATVVRNGQYIGGEAVTDFEQHFAAFLGANHCVTCGNGTDALEIALTALGIGVGDEVIVPAYTWVATAGAVINVGATPVFADVNEKTYCIDPVNVEEAITKKTKAIIAVHLYGHPAAMETLVKIAREYDLKVIEDCAQAHNAAINGEKIGLLGDIATFSFFPTKNLGAMGDGGAIVTDNDQLAHLCFLIRNQGQEKKNVHVTCGRNSRLDTMQAAILSVKLRHLEKWTKQREQIADWYATYLTAPQVIKPYVSKGYRHVYHLYVIQVERRDQLRGFLKENGIDTLIHYPTPLSALEIYQPQDQRKFPVVNDLSKKILSIPMFPELTMEQVQYICERINTFFS